MKSPEEYAEVLRKVVQAHKDAIIYERREVKNGLEDYLRDKALEQKRLTNQVAVNKWEQEYYNLNQDKKPRVQVLEDELEKLKEELKRAHALAKGKPNI